MESSPADKDTKAPEKGDLVRWISDYGLWGADDIGNVWPYDPVYEYGIVMDVSDTDPWSIVVYSTSLGVWITAQVLRDDIEIVSTGGTPRRQIIVPTEAEVKKYEK